MTPAAEHIHLLIDGRNKFITKATSYHAVKELLFESVVPCNYYVEKPPEPEPVEEEEEPELEEEAEEEEEEDMEEASQDDTHQVKNCVRKNKPLLNDISILTTSLKGPSFIEV